MNNDKERERWVWEQAKKNKDISPIWKDIYCEEIESKIFGWGLILTGIIGIIVITIYTFVLKL